MRAKSLFTSLEMYINKYFASFLQFDEYSNKWLKVVFVTMSVLLLFEYKYRSCLVSPDSDFTYSYSFCTNLYIDNNLDFVVSCISMNTLTRA